ncbi:MAG: phosphoribosylanthranilate isomerase [Planctomycetota bacterium]|jgi:phosphoribosylanthranilate isomerase
MTGIKICGITSVRDGIDAELAGAHAVGFVFAPSSRRVSEKQAREISRALSHGTTRVGVFVDAPPNRVRRIAASVPLDLVQLHGNESRSYARNLGVPWLKAFRAGDGDTLDHIQHFGSQPFLLDAYVPGFRGGSGAVADLDLAGLAARLGPMVIAGGLHGANVAHVLERVRPVAVDVSSGVERAPGVKDVDKMALFVREVKRWDSQTTPDTSDASAAGLFPRHCSRP